MLSQTKFPAWHDEGEVLIECAETIYLPAVWGTSFRPQDDHMAADRKAQIGVKSADEPGARYMSSMYGRHCGRLLCILTHQWCLWLAAMVS